MSQAEIDGATKANVLRQLISDASSETPRSLDEGIEQRGAVRFLRRKLEEATREVMTGD